MPLIEDPRAPHRARSNFFSLFSQGMRCRCPRCGQGRIFAATYDLRLNDCCAACGLHLAENDSGDGPAVFLIFILGFLLAPLAVWVEFTFSPPLWAHGVIWSIAALAITIGSLKPVKSLVLFIQYRTRPETWRS